MSNTPLMFSGSAGQSLSNAQSWASNPGLAQNTLSSMANTQGTYPYERNNRVSQFQVERVDNGFVLRSGSKAKVCKDMEELRDFFVAIMVEHQMDK